MLLLAAALLAVLPSAASAHTELASTVPAADATVTDPPVEVVLTFTAALQPGSQPAVRVVDPAGDDLVSAPPTLDGATVTVPLNLAVAPGEHVVDWAITAADGDDQTGSFTFTFAPDATPAPAAPTAPTTPTPPSTDPTAEPTESGTAESATTAPPTEPETPEPSTSATEPALVQADDSASSTATRALVIVAAFFAVAGVGAVMLTRGRGVDR